MFGIEDELQDKIEKLEYAVRYLLSFVPTWAEESEPGLCPTMYGTLTYEGDLRVINEVNRIRKLISK